METNRQRLDRLGMDDDVDTIMCADGDRVCELCNDLIDKNLSPSNPACEGRWCEEAVGLWLDEPAEEADE